MNERESIITFLLQSCDSKNTMIAQLQNKIMELEKRLAESNPVLNKTVEALDKAKVASKTSLPEVSKAN